VLTDVGPVEINVPRDRDARFELDRLPVNTAGRVRVAIERAEGLLVEHLQTLWVRPVAAVPAQPPNKSRFGTSPATYRRTAVRAPTGDA
jgi:hypothetical protein